jgi:hypothetical protein
MMRGDRRVSKLDNGGLRRVAAFIPASTLSPFPHHFELARAQVMYPGHVDQYQQFVQYQQQYGQQYMQGGPMAPPRYAADGYHYLVNSSGAYQGPYPMAPGGGYNGAGGGGGGESGPQKMEVSSMRSSADSLPHHPREKGSRGGGGQKAGGGAGGLASQGASGPIPKLSLAGTHSMRHLNVPDVAHRADQRG